MAKRDKGQTVLKHKKTDQDKQVKVSSEPDQEEGGMDDAFNAGFDFDAEADIALLLGDGMLNNRNGMVEERQQRTVLEEAIVRASLQHARQTHQRGA